MGSKRKCPLYVALGVRRCSGRGSGWCGRWRAPGDTEHRLDWPLCRTKKEALERLADVVAGLNARRTGAPVQRVVRRWGYQSI